VEVLELLQELVAEEALALHRRTARSRRLGAPGRLAAPRSRGASFLGVARSLWGRGQRHDYLVSGTLARISSTTASVAMPSASPSKFRIKRWRSAGAATARMSSTATA